MLSKIKWRKPKQTKSKKERGGGVGRGRSGKVKRNKRMEKKRTSSRKRKAITGDTSSSEEDEPGISILDEKAPAYDSELDEFEDDGFLVGDDEIEFESDEASSAKAKGSNERKSKKPQKKRSKVTILNKNEEQDGRTSYDEDNGTTNDVEEIGSLGANKN